jgi:predicted class III extradiol MEMO1 family dioxygenase
LSLSALNALNNLGYVFLRKQLGIQGSYFVDSNTCIVSSSDFAKIENNRTIDKAKRVVRTALLPELNSPIVLNSDGTIKDTTISYLEGLCETALDELIRNTEISAYGVVINPAQNVLSTSEIVVSISIVPVGVARTITVNIGFVLSI